MSPCPPSSSGCSLTAGDPAAGKYLTQSVPYPTKRAENKKEEALVWPINRQQRLKFALCCTQNIGVRLPYHYGAKMTQDALFAENDRMADDAQKKLHSAHGVVRFACAHDS